ncbi:LysR substrate-binding domain-containing protein [Microvirga sp. VF16]|uniref:LysR substrate-binding domain-containing protein n=1 Tax=Microvirga sp. VF16 TaxID=2807101 RepID=UPI00193E9AE6|nr:LysR substrate-binding domain-containing protein [Microvirga sp. VF16]QRM35905.1 LysR family transcriptional regulator [Microvirga sp. VF16]
MRFTNLPIDILRTFVTVVELGSFTKAGQALGRTQPAITLQMQKLQDLVGCVLVQVTGRDIAPTESGDVLLRFARQILRLNDEAAAVLQRRQSDGILRVGLPTDYAMAFLQRALTNFVKKHQDVQLEVVCDLSQELLARLEADEADIVVAMHGTQPGPGLAFSWAERPIWVAASGGDVHAQTPVPIAAHHKGCEYRSRMIQALDTVDRAWRIAYSSPSIAGLQEAVQSGLGISAMTSRTLTRGMRVLTEADGFPPMTDIRVGLHYKHSQLSTAGLLLASHLIQCLHDSGQTDVIRIDRNIGTSPLNKRN